MGDGLTIAHTNAVNDRSYRRGVQRSDNEMNSFVKID